MVEARGFLVNYRVVYNPIVGASRKRQALSNEVVVEAVLNLKSVVISDLEPTLRYEVIVTAETTAGPSSGASNCPCRIVIILLFKCVILTLPQGL